MKIQSKTVQVIVEYKVEYENENALKRALKDIALSTFANVASYGRNGFYSLIRGKAKLVKGESK